MEMDKNVLSRIKDILKNNPRGMNVTEVVGELGMNRQSVSKYMEMLVMSGHVDVRNFGPSKVYYLSQRLPLSAMLSLSYGFIIVLDRLLNVINVNDHFLEFAGVKREDMLYKSFEKFAFPIEFEPSIMPMVRDALDGTESSVEAFYNKKGSESYYNVRFIPMVMDEGDKGVAIFFEDITARKKIENAIRDSEFKFRSIIEQTLNGIVLIDEQGIIVEFNKSAESITGLKREEIIGKAVWDTAVIFSGGNEKVKEKQKAEIQSYLKTGKSPVDRRMVERGIKRPDGTRRIVQLVIFSIKSDKGYLLSGMYKDITETKLAEKELRQSEENFRSLVESTDAGIVIYQDKKLVSANKAAERILGYTKDELYGLESERIFRFDDLKQGLLESLRNTTDGLLADGEGRKDEREVTIITKSGEPRDLGVTLGTMVYRNKPAIIVTFYDTTQFRRLENELKRSEERYRILAEAAEDVIFIADAGLRATYVNPMGAKFVGLAQADLVGKRIDEVFPPDISAQMVRALTKVIRTGKSQVVEIGIAFFGKEYWWSAKLIPIMENGIVTSVMGHTRDVTDHKNWEAELQKAHNELEARVRDRTRELEVANQALSAEIDRRIVLNRALTESQRTLTTLIGNLPGIAYRCKNDEFWTMDFISDGCRELTGYEPADVIGNRKISYEEIVHPDDRKMIRDQIEWAIEHNTQFNITYRIVTTGGNVRRVNEQGRGVFLPNGELVDVEGYISDITDMVDLRISRDRSEERYRELVESISDIIWETDKDLRFTYVSPRVMDILGMKPEEAIGMTPYDIMPPEEALRMKKLMAPIKEKPGVFPPVASMLRHKNGKNITVDISARPHFNDRNELQGYRGITRKISATNAGPTGH